MRIPQTPPRWFDILREVQSRSPDEISRLVTSPFGSAPEGRYRHWETLRFITPPEGWTLHEMWAALKLARNQTRRSVPLVDAQGHAFGYTLPDPLLERLHRLDSGARGTLSLPEAVTNPETRDRYIVSSLAEEAITSSQLEGAATTRAVAKEMLRTNRAPRTKDEQMILNNYQAMRRIQEVRDQPMSRSLLLELHRIITRDTLASDAVFRSPGDGIGVYSDTDELLHRPPPAGQIEERIEALCSFANGAPAEGFLHPFVKAILLHFWLAYDHPFVDGNGRTARALFYWYALREGYWLMEFVSISSILKKAPARYGKSFLYTETDDNDLTYFVLAQLRAVEQAVDALHAFLKRKSRQLQEAHRLLRPGADLNPRQLALLGHALRKPGRSYTIASHKNSHAIVYATARADLIDLEARGLLHKRKKGRAFLFSAAPDLPDLLKAIGA